MHADASAACVFFVVVQAHHVKRDPAVGQVGAVIGAGVADPCVVVVNGTQLVQPRWRVGPRVRPVGIAPLPASKARNRPQQDAIAVVSRHHLRDVIDDQVSVAVLEAKVLRLLGGPNHQRVAGLLKGSATLASYINQKDCMAVAQATEAGSVAPPTEAVPPISADQLNPATPPGAAEQQGDEAGFLKRKLELEKQDRLRAIPDQPEAQR